MLRIAKYKHTSMYKSHTQIIIIIKFIQNVEIFKNLCGRT
jgi:hypothetical protein